MKQLGALAAGAVMLLAAGCDGTQMTGEGGSGLAAAGSPTLSSHVAPVLYTDLPNSGACSELGYAYEYKINDPTDGSSSDGALTVTVTINGSTFDWSANGGVDAVVSKGGPNANVYFYSPAETSDDGLHSPLNPKNGKYYGLSHVSFCYGEIPPPCEGEGCEPPPCEGEACEPPPPCEGEACEPPPPCEGESCEPPPPPCDLEVCDGEGGGTEGGGTEGGTEGG